MNLSLQTATNLSTATAIPSSVNRQFIDSLSEQQRPDWSSVVNRTELVADLSTLSIEELVQFTQREMRRYLRTSESDTQYSYELFRRALDAQDEAAWYALSTVYHGLLKSWVTNHSKFASSGEDAEYFVNRALERLWRYVALRPGKFANFGDVAALLQYTKMCVHAAVMDDAPAMPVVADLHVLTDGDAGAERELEVRPNQVSIEQQERCNHLVQDDFEKVEQSEFWLRVDKFLLDETERIVLFGFFVEGLKNREMLALYPEHFDDTKQISNKRTSILRRLSRNPEFKEVLQDFFHDDRDLSGALIC